MSVTHQKIAQLLIPLFVNNPKISLIDYGCGDGELLRYISPKKILKYQGFDISQKAIHVAKKKHPEKFASFQKIEPNTLVRFGKKNSNHAVALIGVAQYLSDQELAGVLREAHKTLTTDGRLVISCSVDHTIYRICNMYRFFIPHQYVQRSEIIDTIKQSGFRISHASERGLIFAPLFSNVLSLFFDGIDQVFLRTKGEIGPVGRAVRSLVAPIIAIEHKLNIDFGYTLYLVAEKK